MNKSNANQSNEETHLTVVKDEPVTLETFGESQRLPHSLEEIPENDTLSQFFSTNPLGDWDQRAEDLIKENKVLRDQYTKQTELSYKASLKVGETIKGLEKEVSDLKADIKILEQEREATDTYNRNLMDSLNLMLNTFEEALEKSLVNTNVFDDDKSYLYFDNIEHYHEACYPVGRTPKDI